MIMTALRSEHECLTRDNTWHLTRERYNNNFTTEPRVIKCWKQWREVCKDV